MTSQKDNRIIRHWLQTWDELMAQVQHFTPESIIQSPDQGSWSVQQVIQHLALSENLSLQYLRKKTLDPSTIPQKDFSYPIRKALLYLYLASPFKFKAPGIVSDNQFPNEHFESTLDGLKANQKELLNFLANLPAQARTGLVYRHPIAGRLDLDGMFQFFTWHIQHHNRQIERIRYLFKEQGSRPHKLS